MATRAPGPRRPTSASPRARRERQRSGDCRARSRSRERRPPRPPGVVDHPVPRAGPGARGSLRSRGWERPGPVGDLVGGPAAGPHLDLRGPTTVCTTCSADVHPFHTASAARQRRPLPEISASRPSALIRRIRTPSGASAWSTTPSPPSPGGGRRALAPTRPARREPRLGHEDEVVAEAVRLGEPHRRGFLPRVFASVRGREGRQTVNDLRLWSPAGSQCCPASGVRKRPRSVARKASRPAAGARGKRMPPRLAGRLPRRGPGRSAVLAAEEAARRWRRRGSGPSHTRSRTLSPPRPAGRQSCRRPAER